MNSPNAKQFYISVDIETAGPNPSQYSMLTLGACTIDERRHTFYVELKPVNDKITAEAFAIHHLDVKRLAERGTHPAHAMENFEAWLKAETPQDANPICVAFNAPFDWMFINDYFYRYLGRNPLGHNAVDIKSFYMAHTGVAWPETSSSLVRARYLHEREFTHHALRDALDQAEIFEKMLAESRQRNLPTVE